MRCATLFDLISWHGMRYYPFVVFQYFFYHTQLTPYFCKDCTNNFFSSDGFLGSHFHFHNANIFLAWQTLPLTDHGVGVFKRQLWNVCLF